MDCNWKTYVATCCIEFLCYMTWIAVVFGSGSDTESEELWWGAAWLGLSIDMTVGVALKIAFAFNMYYYYDEQYGTSRRLLSKHGMQLIILD